MHLTVSRAVGEVAVIAADLFYRRVPKELLELVPDPTNVLHQPLHRGGRVCQRLEIALSPHGCELEHLDLVLNQLADFYRVKGGVV